jgi:hypothetical protein
MAKLPSLKRIISDSLTKYQDLNEPVFAVLNNFMESVSRALNGNLTFSENMDSQIMSFTDNGVYPIKLAWSRTSKPRAIWLGAISRVDGSDPVLSTAVTPNWKFSQNGQIEIISMVGLSASSTNKYNITLIAITG